MSVANDKIEEAKILYGSMSSLLNLDAAEIRESS